MLLVYSPLSTSPVKLPVVVAELMIVNVLTGSDDGDCCGGFDCCGQCGYNGKTWFVVVVMMQTVSGDECLHY